MKLYEINREINALTDELSNIMYIEFGEDYRKSKSEISNENGNKYNKIATAIGRLRIEHEKTLDKYMNP